MRELVINLAGDYDVCTMRRLCREIQPAASWTTNVVLDMSKVKFIDATCANELMKLMEERIGIAGTQLVVPDERTRELFLYLGLDAGAMRTPAFGRSRHFERPA